MIQDYRIGVIDSGVGGITVWAEIVRMMPELKVVYYADTANCPYGGRSDQQIVSLTKVCVERLLGLGCELIVLACNTITAAAVDVLRRSYRGVMFVGMEPAVKPAALATRSAVVGILATRATLRGRLYLDTSHRWAQGVRLVEMAGDGLVEMVEQGRVGSRECDDLLVKYIGPMVEQGADQVVLGCTHYPFLSQSIERLSHGKLKVVQPARAVASRVAQLLGQPGGQIAKTVRQIEQAFSAGGGSFKEQPTLRGPLEEGVEDLCGPGGMSDRAGQRIAAEDGGQYSFISSVEEEGEIERIQQLALGYYQSIL